MLRDQTSLTEGRHEGVLNRRRTVGTRVGLESTYHTNCFSGTLICGDSQAGGRARWPIFCNLQSLIDRHGLCTGPGPLPVVWANAVPRSLRSLTCRFPLSRGPVKGAAYVLYRLPVVGRPGVIERCGPCLLYTSDAADE